MICHCLKELPSPERIQTKKRNSLGISLSLYTGRFMRMVTIYGFPIFRQSLIMRSLIASILATMGILGGIIPEISWHKPRISFNYLAYTQDFNDSQINNYAKAVLEIEPLRQSAFERIQEIIGKSPPNIVCYEPDTFKGLPREAQRIAVEYCNQSKAIVEKSGLTVRQFNDMTVRVRSDQELKRRIQNAIIRLRQQKR